MLFFFTLKIPEVRTYRSTIDDILGSMKYRIKMKTKGTREVGEQKVRRRITGNVCREGPAKRVT